MLRQIKNGLKLMENKLLVDTIFSIGKLHKQVHRVPKDLDKYGDLKFF
jgi:hypothetical protein